MPKLKTQYDFSNIKDPEKFLDKAPEFLSEIGDTVNGKLEFDANIKSQTVQVSFSAASIDTAVPHLLAKAGVKYFQAGSSVPCQVYHGLKTDTQSTIFLRSTAAGIVTVVLF